MKITTGQGLRWISLGALWCLCSGCSGAEGESNDTSSEQTLGCDPAISMCPGTSQSGATPGTPSTPGMEGAQMPGPVATDTMPATDPPLMMGEPMISEPMTPEPMMATDAEEDTMPPEPTPEETPTEPEEAEEPNPEEVPDEELEEDPPEVDPEDTMSVPELPMTDYCGAVAEWDSMWEQWEAEVLLIVNENRAEGWDCGEAGSFEPAGPLEIDATLTCAARVHSLDMYERGFFDHTNPDGEDPFDRMEEAGFEGGRMGENIAQGYGDPAQVMEGWMSSDGHCSNIMNDGFTLIGIGYYPGDMETRFGDSNYWTQTFGSPPRDFGGGR